MPGAGGGAASCCRIGSLPHIEKATVPCTVRLTQSEDILFFPVLIQEPIRVRRATTSKLGYGLSQAKLTRSRQFRVCACGCLHVQTLRFSLLMSSRSRCSRACRCCSLQTKHIMCFAPATLKYLRLNIASHAAHCTNSQLPHMSARSLLLVHRKADKVLYIPHFLQFFLILRTVDADASATTSAVSLRTVDADASVTISAASPGDRAQSNRISSKFRCGR